MSDIDRYKSDTLDCKCNDYRVLCLNAKIVTELPWPLGVYEDQKTAHAKDRAIRTRPIPLEKYCIIKDVPVKFLECVF